MKNIAIVLSLLTVVSQVSFAKSTGMATSSKKMNKEAAISRLPKKKYKKDPKYSSMYPYTSSTPAQETVFMGVQQSRLEFQEEIAAKESAKKWFIKFDSENMKNVNENNPAGFNGDISAVQTLSYGYKFTELSTVQISQDWSQAYGYGTTAEGKENAHSNSYEDLNFRYTYGSLFKTEKSNLAGQLRYYAPSSSNSQNAGQVGQLRAYGIYDYTLTPQWTAGLLVSPRFFMQTANAYETEDGKILNNNHWRLLNLASLSYSPNDWFGLKTEIGIYSKKKYNESTKHFQAYGTAALLNFSNMGIEIGLRSSDGAYDTREKGGLNLYDMDVSEYYGILSIKI